MFRSILVKELLLLRRDPRALLRLLILPVAFIVLFGKVFQAADKPPLAEHPIAVWLDPGSSRAKLVVDALAHSGMFQPLQAPTADDVRKHVADETFDVGLVIGSDFDPMGGHPAELVIDEGASPAATKPLIGSITAILTRAITGAATPPRMVVPKTPPGIPKPLGEMSAFQVSVPGNAVLFGFFIALTCALSFAEERRTGTGRRLLAAPVARWQLLIAKLLPYVALGAIQVGLLFAIGVFGFGMRVGGSVAGLVIMTIGVASCAASLGLLLASVSTTEKQISSLGSVVVLVMGLLGGCMLPRVLMPHVMQQIGLFVPHGWALDGYYTMLVREGSTLADVAKPIAAVYGFAVLFLAAGLKRYRFE